MLGLVTSKTGALESKDAIKRRRTDCRRAESDLTTLEEQLGH